MKIAVASQNRKEITGHTGRCRKFWIYTIDNNTISEKELLELPKEESFHESSPFEPSPLDHMQVLITGGMGTGLARRLEQKNIQALITKETDPEKAVKDFLNGTLKTEPFEPHEHGHAHEHSHH
ncbi:MAG: NifB/NifX family molybdenum-iron cluster-binding protein [Methylicorpusculum sp.]|uniref:NifB/NifX family molybdenum-iron cluster-binding protein n=1 Tax=Methylicorpusculum sp. TaxID=2713644 RepID=UPI0027222F1C|nr:NifB/NifX family molybdenum-iron cluster-binding protein [Methylicorpusculum sp.]MDO8940803.1 NifB/NifX family molybdenum-iron cluster-binding protein [Methylicorpusculum sp.]MDP2204434.1 NifB/NifX family molybdenum-iron cluster-binding protein [Methylicorpusculum sp.]